MLTLRDPCRDLQHGVQADAPANPRWSNRVGGRFAWLHRHVRPIARHGVARWRDTSQTSRLGTDTSF